MNVLSYEWTSCLWIGPLWLLSVYPRSRGFNECAGWCNGRRLNTGWHALVKPMISVLKKTDSPRGGMQLARTLNSFYQFNFLCNWRFYVNKYRPSRQMASGEGFKILGLNEWVLRFVKYAIKSSGYGHHIKLMHNRFTLYLLFPSILIEKFDEVSVPPLYINLFYL